MMIAVTGATGFIGSALVNHLLEQGHRVRAIGRSRHRLPAQADFFAADLMARLPPGAVRGADAVIHLAGETVAQRWTPEVKARIRDSRVMGTRNLVRAIQELEQRPRVLVSASATGYYGDRGEEELAEEAPPARDFLAQVCVAWEREAMEAQSLGCRVVRTRIGVVLGPGGALAKMAPIFRLGLGGRLGSGKQWMPWIHREDLVRLLLFAMQQESLEGAVNATSPAPVRNADFTHAFAQALHRPALFSVPEFALRLAVGEMAAILLASQKVLPRAAQAAGFEFAFQDIRQALQDVISRW
jgi:uncharacterized protein (TIGR01777 family)